MWGRAAGGSAAERADELEEERRRWAAGAAGERQVGAELDRLPDIEWWVFHDIPRGKTGTNIDHLAIGVGGVFTVNTKNVAGNVWVAERVLMVNGEKTNYLPVAVSEARDVSARLSRAAAQAIDARPVLAFVGPPTIKEMPADVEILHLRNVREWLQSQPRVFTPAEAYDIVLWADRATTWV